MFVRLAAPSCVVPHRVGINCQVLAHHVSEVALMLLEAQSCLEYDDQDLPLDLPDLGLTYHAHLPLDLAWDTDLATTLAAIEALVQKIAFVRPWQYVLHPPAPGYLSTLAQHSPILAQSLSLENIRHADLVDIWDELASLQLGVCLDLGHMISYDQYHIVNLPGFFDRLRMLHVYGGESPQGHLGLHALPDAKILRDILFRLNRDCVVVVEIFHWEEFCRSLHMLRTWLDAWGIAHD
ncbi:MAG: hypothetical protein GX043_05255 [Desulfovibrionales bacterium]|nr:hypothetical protein [Desulfovibrionales bacterium]